MNSNGLRKRRGVGGCAMEPLENRLLLAVEPVINEFMAKNDHGLVDVFGKKSDWIEIYNPGSNMDLGGWHLKYDDGAPADWQFPTPTSLGSGAFLVVFASGKNITSGAELHTNFKLKDEGADLWLTRPDGSTASSYLPYPGQLSDVSYGIGPSTQVSVTPISASQGAAAKVLVPTDGSLGSTWTGGAFDDSTWSDGSTALGYDYGTSPPLPAELEPNGTWQTANDARYNFVPASGGNAYFMHISGSMAATAPGPDNDDNDWFKIGGLEVGDVITISDSAAGSLRGTRVGTRVQLHRQGQSGSMIDRNTNGSKDGAATADSLIWRYTVGINDVYYVRARPWIKDGLPGTYDLGIWLEKKAGGASPTTGGTHWSEQNDAANKDMAGAEDASGSWRQVQYQMHTGGAVGTVGDIDCYRYQFTAGDLVSFRVTNASGSALDAKVTLLDAAGNRLAVEDGTSSTGTGGSGPLADSFIYSYPIASTGSYYLKVEATGGTTGSYDVDAYLAGNTAPPAPGSVGTNYDALIATNLSAGMYRQNASLYSRLHFEVDDPSAVAGLSLSMQYSDGFVAYLNGQMVAGRNAPAAPVYNSAATASRTPSQALTPEVMDLLAFKSALVAGDNVLAIQGLSSSQPDNDLLILPQLTYVRTDPGPVVYFTTPTPRVANGAGSVAQVGDTKLEGSRGFHDAPFDVTITTATAEAVIRYTTDGRAPTATTGTVYTGPVHITTTTTLRAAAFKPGYIASDVDTETYIFAADVIRQGDATHPLPAGFPATWVDRYGNVAPGTPSGADYAMDPEVVNDPVYTSRIINDLKAIPSISIVLNPDDMFGNGSSGTNGIKGIYTNPTARDASGAASPLWERASSIELINPDGSSGFQIDAGIKMHGGASRTPGNTPKHSFTVSFGSAYDGALKFPLFGDGAVDSLDGFILRAGYNNTWEHWDAAQRGRGQYIQDQWTSDTQLAMGDLSKHGTLVNLYINGVYWGLYAPVEQPSADFAASYQGGDKSDYDVVKISDDTSGVPGAIDGNMAAWNTMFAKANTGLGTDAAYQEFKKWLDIPSFIDYMILNFYGGNQDWDYHNFYAIRRSRQNGLADDNLGGFRFISWDAERVLENPTGDNVVGWERVAQGPNRLFNKLKANAEFRQQFADRVHALLFNGGVLSPAQAAQRYRAEAALVDEAIVGESARWGDYRRDVYVRGAAVLYARNGTFLTEENRILNAYFPVRAGALIAQLRAAGVYPSIDAPELNQFGGQVAGGFQLTMTNLSGGQLLYCLDGSDPRLPDGAVNPAALMYSGPIALAGNANVMARILTGGTWSALTNAAFYVSSPPMLRITELMYNPVKPAGSVFGGDDYQFVELQNLSGGALDLTGMRLSGVGDFVFPAMTLPAGGRTVVVSNLDAFRQRYGEAVSVAGVYGGHLAHGGEKLTLATAAGQVIEQFAYDGGWYSTADGEGYSLVAVDALAFDQALSDKSGWRPSMVNGGAPGAADDGWNNNAVVINEVLPSTANPWIELHNTTGDDINVGDWFLSDANDDAAALMKYRIAPGTMIPAGGYITFTRQLHFGAAFTLSGGGGHLYLSGTDGDGGLGGYRQPVDFGASEAGVSFGRFVKSTGEGDLVALAGTTFGWPNSPPAAGPVVINEVMYNPANGGDEFIELRNISAQAVVLDGWQFTDGISYTIPAGTTLAAGGLLLVTPMDDAAFRSRHAGIDASVAILGPYSGTLQDGGERLELCRPQSGMPTAMVLVDHVSFKADSPWAIFAAGCGPSLQRKVVDDYGNDPANWIPGPAGGTPGAANVTVVAPTVVLAGDAAINEGGTFTSSGSFADTDSGQTWTAMVDWGDGVPAALALNADMTFALSHQYTASGIFNVKVTVTDSQGMFGWAMAKVTVANVAPTATLNRGSAAINEGQTTTVSLSSRADASSADYTAGLWQSFDFDNDGVFEVNNLVANGVAVSIPTMYTADGPRTLSVRARLIDQDGAARDYTTTITVNGVVPVVTTAGNSAVNLGVYQSAGSWADPGLETWTGTVDYGDGNGAQPLVLTADKTFSLSCNYVLPGSHTVTVAITDSSGAVGTSTFTVTVNPIITGSELADHYYLRANGGNVQVYGGDNAGGTLLCQAAATFGSPVVFHSLGGDDVYTIDLSGGLAAPAGGIALNGQGGSNSLRLAGGSNGVTVDGGQVLLGGKVVVTNSVQSLVFSGGRAAPVAIVSNPLFSTVSIDGGDYLLSQAVATPALGLVVSNGATVAMQSALDVMSVEISQGASVKLGGGHLRTGALSIGADALLDLADQGLIVPSDALDQDAMLAAVRLLAEMGGGHGIVGTGGGAGAGAAGKAVSVLLNDDGAGGRWLGQFGGLPVDGHAILAKYTWRGDVDLDGTVDVDDYFRIDSGFMAGRTGLINGDLDDSGKVDGDDYFLIDRSFMLQQEEVTTSQLSAASPADPPSAVAATKAASGWPGKVRKAAMGYQVLEVSSTPNPNARKFVVAGIISPKPAGFGSLEAAASNPLAAQLFAIKGVTSVLLLGDFVTVNKVSDLPWPPIVAAVKRVLKACGK